MPYQFYFLPYLLADILLTSTGIDDGDEDTLKWLGRTNAEGGPLFMGGGRGAPVCGCWLLVFGSKESGLRPAEWEFYSLTHTHTTTSIRCCCTTV